jgi:nitronate monooxygenase
MAGTSLAIISIKINTLETVKNLKQVLGIKYPIMQGAMLGVSTPQLAAAVSNQGGLGSLAAGGLSAEETRQLIRETQKLTDRSFAVNVFATIPAMSDDTVVLLKMQAFLKKFCRRNRIPYFKSPPPATFHSYREQTAVIISEDVDIVSFTFGVLDDNSITSLKDHGIRLIGTATCVEEAKLLEQKGVDVVVAQGIEAGWHRGSFLGQDVPLIGGMSLIPLVTDAVKIPVLAAGGISDRRSYKAALILGASGVVAGSLFIPANESAVSELYKNSLQAIPETAPVLTKAFSGKWGRAIKNDFIVEIEKSGLTIPTFCEQLGLTYPIRSFGATHQRADLLPMWAGQSAAKAQRGDAAAIMMALLQDPA